MKKLFTLIFTSIFVSLALADDSPETRMEGVGVVCELKGDQPSFLAFNLTDSRIWVGGNEFKDGAKGLQLRDVTVQRKKNGFDFTAILEMSWGQDVQINEVEGTVSRLSSKVPRGHVTVRGVKGKAGTEESDLLCKKI